MFSHTTVGSSDIGKSRQFYDAVMTALGHELFYHGPKVLGYGQAKDSQFWVMPPFDGGQTSVGNGTHIALLTQKRAQVRAAYEAALANGGTDEGAPGLRPHYHANYYGAYFRDLDGNKLQVVCHMREEESSQDAS